MAAIIELNDSHHAKIRSTATNYERLQRILDISGLDARSLYTLIDLLIVCDCQLRGAV
jgi:hypothetical protein